MEGAVEGAVAAAAELEAWGHVCHSMAHAHDASYSVQHVSHLRVRGPTATARKGRRQTEQDEGDASGAVTKGAHMRCASAAGRRTLQRHGSSFEYLHGWRDDDA